MLGFHSGGLHFEGLARAYDVGKEGVAAKKGPGHGVFLMRPQLDFRVHAGECEP